MSTADTAKAKGVAMTLIERLSVLAAKMDTGPAWADPSIVREAAAALEIAQKDLRDSAVILAMSGNQCAELAQREASAVQRAERAEKRVLLVEKALEEAQRDATRYRWLRDSPDEKLWALLSDINDGPLDGDMQFSKDAWNAAIDAAIKGDA